MIDLLCCPFCGAKAAMSVLEDDEPGEIISAWISCSCGVEIHERRTEEEAAACWNTRTATYTEICMNEKCPRGQGTPAEVMRRVVGGPKDGR